MKKIQFIVHSMLVIGLMMAVSSQYAFAATTTPTPSKTPTISSSEKNESLVEHINELKDKIASRVAQLNLVEKRGVVGTVETVNDMHITISTLQGDLKLIDVDEITKFSSPSAKTGFGISDLSKGSHVSVTGLYNKESKRILARYVNGFALPTFLSGKVSGINEDDFTITVSNKDNTITTVDIDTTTKINSYTNGEIDKAGFSKIATGNRVEIVGYADKSEKNRLSASYILIVNGLTPPAPSKAAK